MPASMLFVVAVGVWAGVVALSRGMGAMPAAMGLSLGLFVAVWSLMMTAMMLPSIARCACASP